MEYITGIITLQAIFSHHWASYCNWYQGTIRDAVTENVTKIMIGIYLLWSHRI